MCEAAADLFRFYSARFAVRGGIVIVVPQGIGAHDEQRFAVAQVGRMVRPFELPAQELRIDQVIFVGQRREFLHVIVV